MGRRRKPSETYTQFLARTGLPDTDQNLAMFKSGGYTDADFAVDSRKPDDMFSSEDPHLLVAIEEVAAPLGLNVDALWKKGHRGRIEYSDLENLLTQYVSRVSAGLPETSALIAWYIVGPLLGYSPIPPNEAAERLGMELWEFEKELETATERLHVGDWRALFKRFDESLG